MQTTRKLVASISAHHMKQRDDVTSGVASFIGVAPGSPAAAGEMKGGVMIAGVQPGRLPCMRTAWPRDRACRQE